MSADFTQAFQAVEQSIHQHADRDGLRGVARACFIDRGGHAPGQTCPTAPPKQDRHVYWCQWPDDECSCPPR